MHSNRASLRAVFPKDFTGNGINFRIVAKEGAATKPKKNPSNTAHLTSDSKEALIESLRGEGILVSPAVEEAFRSVRREDFLWPGEPAALAYSDEPLLLGETNQTISAPHMVVIMLEALDLSPGMKVLEIGAGSGYNAALIGKMVSSGIAVTEPRVVSVERDERLVEFASLNIKRSHLERVVSVVSGDGSLGYPERSSKEAYDRITVTAASPWVPQFLTKQLKLDGQLLAPIRGRNFQTLVKLRKISEKTFKREELGECMFVPLIGADAFAA